MTSSSPPPADDDAYWRRPADQPEAGLGGAAQPQPQPSTPPYQGPPRSAPPPFGWRPPMVTEPAAPRPMPAQDHAALDQRQQTAQTVTNGVGIIASAIMVLLLLVLCGRWLLH